MAQKYTREGWGYSDNLCLKSQKSQSGEENKLLPQFWLSLPNNINILAVIIQRILEENKS